MIFLKHSQTYLFATEKDIIFINREEGMNNIITYVVHLKGTRRTLRLNSGDFETLSMELGFQYKTEKEDEY